MIAYFVEYAFANLIRKWLCNIQNFPRYRLQRTLESGKYDSAVLHFGVNNLLQKTLSNSDTVENLIENIRKADLKCMSHGVSRVFVSPIVRNKRIPESLLEEVNQKISFMCKNDTFIFIDNSNISNIHLFDDGLRLVESGRCTLANNVIDPINGFLLAHLHHPNIHIHAMK